MVGCNFRCPWCSNPECFAADTRTTERSVTDLCDEILRSRPMFFSGGGVTFTGGEPTLQFEALRELLVLLKEEMYTPQWNATPRTGGFPSCFRMSTS